MNETEVEQETNPSRCLYLVKAMLYIGVIGAFVIVCLNIGYYNLHSESRYNELINVVADRHKVDPLMVKAIIKRESNFRHRAIGGKGEIGLMQLMEGAVKDWEKAHGKSLIYPDDIFDPKINIEIGTWYFAKGVKQWHKSEQAHALALAQYNAGRANLLKWIAKNDDGKNTQLEKLVEFPDTLKYVNKILNYYEEYVLRDNGEIN
ncbi:MAG: lytic transglycosylase domain-containing protein [Lentisphaeria bacterium]